MYCAIMYLYYKDIIMKLLNLKKLIGAYNEDASSDYAIETDNVAMYMEDANDATVVLEYLNEEKITAAAEYINRLDTMVREAIVIAIKKDTSADWVAENLDGRLANEIYCYNSIHGKLRVGRSETLSRLENEVRF